VTLKREDKAPPDEQKSEFDRGKQKAPEEKPGFCGGFGMSAAPQREKGKTKCTHKSFESSGEKT